MNTSIFRANEPAIERLFGRRKAVIGVIHSWPLPGSPHYEGESVESIYRYACEEAERYGDGGVDGLIVENHGDIPFAKPDEGFVEGKAGAASSYRAALRARDIAIFTDVHVKHGAHAIVADCTLAQLTQDAEFFDADAVIVTGQRTGDSAKLDELQAVSDATKLPVLVGSGVNADNVASIFDHADAVIVASALKHGGSWWNAVDPARLAQFMAVVRQVRQTHGVR